MAQVSANRTSQRHALDLRFRVYTPEGVRLKLASLTKKRKAGTPGKECFYAFIHCSPKTAISEKCSVS